MLTNRKSILLIILIILLCYIFSSSVMAAEDVNLLIEGELVASNLLIKEQDDNLLISKQALIDVFELDVELIDLINTINTEYNGQQIKLRVGESYFEIDEQVKDLGAEVYLESEQVFIPVQFLTEVFDYRVDFSDGNLKLSKASIEIKEITYRSKDLREKILIEFSEKPDYDIQELNSPERLMIDIFDARLSNGSSNLAINNGHIFQVRSRQPEVDRSRIILDLYQPLIYSLDSYSEDDSYYLSFKINPRIIDFEYNPHRDQFILISTETLTDYSQEYLEDSNELIVEFPGVLLDVVESRFPLDDDLFESVRLSQHNENTASVRMLFRMQEGFNEEDLELNIYSEGENLQKLILSPNRLRQSSLEPEEEITEQDELLAKPVELNEVILSKENNNTIKIKTDREVKPFVIPLRENSRLVLDFPETIFRPVKEDLNFEENFIKRIRIAQFEREITRVVIELEELVNYELSQQESEKGYLTELSLNISDTEQSDLENLDSNKSLESVNVFKEGKYTNLEIELDSQADYKIREFKYPDRLVVDIPGVFVDLDSEQFTGAQGLVEEIRVSQFTREPLVARVVFELSNSVAYQVLSSSQTEKIQLQFKDFEEESQEKSTLDDHLEGRLIVVDAGHGGADPGAIGFSGVLEKDVVLDISKRLEELLIASGAQVKMTRTDDYYVNLLSRAEIANDLAADILISVHANSHENFRYRDIGGIETYIHPDANHKTLLLANSIQDTMVKELGLIDRGVKKDQLYVLSKANMPAVLAEVAFLSNAEEEKLLASSDFRQQAAIAIYNGLLDYFN